MSVTTKSLLAAWSDIVTTIFTSQLFHVVGSPSTLLLKSRPHLPPCYLFTKKKRREHDVDRTVESPPDHFTQTLLQTGSRTSIDDLPFKKPSPMLRWGAKQEVNTGTYLASLTNGRRTAELISSCSGDRSATGTTALTAGLETAHVQVLVPRQTVGAS